MGIIVLIFNAFGLAALWRGWKIRSKCLFITYFIGSIIGCVVLAVLFVISMTYAVQTGNGIRWGFVVRNETLE